MRTIAILGLSMVVGACGAEGTPGPQESQLHIATHTATTFQGDFDDGVARIAFHAEETSQNVVHLQLTTAVRTLSVDANFDTGTIRGTGAETALTQEELDAFVALDAELATVVGDRATPAERVMTGWATFMTQAVPGVAWQDVHAQSARGWVNIGAGDSCRTLYGDSAHGYCTPYKQTGLNSPNCKGRCGAGCGSAHTGGNNKWTMDCAEHDYMIGPFGDCADDATFAANVYTSGGTPYCASNCSCADGC